MVFGEAPTSRRVLELGVGPAARLEQALLTEAQACLPSCLPPTHVPQ